MKVTVFLIAKETTLQQFVSGVFGETVRKKSITKYDSLTLACRQKENNVRQVFVCMC